MLIDASPAKRRKKGIDQATAVTAGVVACTSVDIEDLHDSRCHLLCAPILHSQSTTDYPLSRTYDFHSEIHKACGQYYPFGLPTIAENPRPNGSTRDRLRDSSRIHFSSKFVSEVAVPIDLEPGPNERLTTTRGRSKRVKQQSTLSKTSSHTQTPRQSSQCLLERLNPEYFGQDKYKWHSSMEQEPDTSGMMSIDPESAQDFTTLYMNKSLSLPEDMMQTTPLNSDIEQLQWSMPELDGASSRSTLSSPDALSHVGATFDRQESEESLFELDAFEDVNRMFDWDGACASLVDEPTPEYKDMEIGTPTMVQYNASAFRTINMISNRQPYAGLQVNTSIYPLGNCYMEAGMNILDNCVATTSSSPGEEDEGPSTTCHNCGVTKTPLWRRTPDKRHSLCNACGLYLKQYKTMRPLVPRNRPQVAKKDEVCTNCEATKTSLWRKDENGAVICNACGLYFKLHGKTRPVTMRKEKISRRKRYRNLSSERPDGTGKTPAPIVQPVSVVEGITQVGQVAVQA